MQKTTNQILKSETDMIKRIRSEIRRLTKQENLNSTAQGFILWVLCNYFDLDILSASSYILDHPNDKRIDAFFEDDDTIKIIQCKFFADTVKELGSNDIATFKGCIDWLKSPSQIKKTKLPRLYNASVTFSERWEEASDIQLHYFVFGGFSNDAFQEHVVFNLNSSMTKAQMHLHDIDDIITIYRTKLQIKNPLVDEECFIDLFPGEYYIRNNPIRSIVATIKGKDLINLYSKYRDLLFERNIRYYKGSRIGTINRKIVETILDDKEHDKFWYYNNGISFVCNHFDIIESGKDSQTKLKVTGFQIINGCQTTVCLYDAERKATMWDKIPEDIQIVVRFIEAASEDEIDSITLYTNSQNPVSVIQLKSNDSLQKRLKTELAQFNPPYFYSIKEGDWQQLTKKEREKFSDRRLEMSEAAQAIYSFKTDPAFSRRWKSKLFSEKYMDIFKQDMAIEEILLPYSILNIIRNKISLYRREEFNLIGKDKVALESSKIEEIKKKEFLLYSDLNMLYYIGKLIKIKYGVYNENIAKKLFNNKLKERVERCFDYIVVVLRYSEALKQQTNIQRYLKNLDNVDILFYDVKKDIEKATIMDKKDPLKEFFPEI